MSKKIVLLSALLLTLAVSSVSAVELDKDTIYYPNATVNSAIAKYKAENYTGCLQELFSVTKKNPSNALAYYYMAMAYTHLDMQAEAIEAYEKVIALNPDKYLSDYAEKGRDCLTGGPLCAVEGVAQEGQDELDKFISSPYGDSGMSQELMNEVKQKELYKIKDTINKKENLEVEDLQKIKDFDNNQSMEEETIKIAQVSDEEVLQAINTLKEAGLNLSVQSENSYINQYQDPRMAEMSMLLGGNNYNNNNSMMNMLPMLMNKAEKGENIDPRFVQTMMMNSMMTDFANFNSDNNNRY